MVLALHMPIEDTFGAVLETVLKPQSEILQPFTSFLFVEAKDQTVPIGDLDALLALLDPGILLFGRNPGVGIIKVLVVLVVFITDARAEEMDLCGDLLEFFVPFPQHLVDVCHGISELPS